MERRQSFPTNKSGHSLKEFGELEKHDEIVSTKISGCCFTYNKESKYGLGLGLAELANLDFEYAKNCQKLVQAKVGRRVTLEK
jgi:hypothetical protein